MDKHWEFRIEEAKQRPQPHTFATLYDMEDVTDRVNKLGLEGWEPFGVQWPAFFLRRECDHG